MSLLAEVERTESKHDPGGGLWERLDTSRREIVELCGEKGVMLFRFLLASSTHLPGQEDIAVCPLQRLHDVALQLQASPDTVKRYVAVFRALSLVQHYHDQRREVKLQIPLGLYRPLTNFTTLDELIGMRKKQRQLAQKVKIRYITRFGDPTLAYSDEVRTTFQELSTILEGEHLEPLKRQRLQMKIADLLTQLVGKSGSSKGDLNDILDDLQAAPSRQEPAMPARVGDSNEGLEAFCLRKKPGKGSHQVGDLKLPEGDFILQGTIPSRQQAQQSGDSDLLEGDPTIIASSAVAYQSEQQGDLNQSMGDSNPPVLVQPDVLSQPNHEGQGDSDLQAGDLVLRQSTQQPPKNDYLGDSNGQVVLKVGDSNPVAAVEVRANAPYTYNVNYLISNISGNNAIRKQLAKFLAGILEKNEYENGYPTFSKYLKAFKGYSPEVIGRAFLATMVLLHRKHWRVEKPGATFTDQCRVLSGQLPFANYTLVEIEEWMQAWGHLPYAELITALAAPLPEPVSPDPAPLVTIPNRTSGGTHGKGLLGPFGATSTNKKKRTYGLQYSGLPTVNKDLHSLGSPKPPDAHKKS